MINNRQNGRRRGRGGQRPGGGNPGRPESGNRIDNRARGNASQLYEKYKTLAADAQRQGDRVNTEYYLQFADHYFRVLAESRPRVDEQQARAQGRDDYDDDFDGDGEEYGQEGEPAQPGQYQPRADDRYRQDARQSQDRQGQDRQGQDGRQQDARQQDDRPRQQPRQASMQGQDDRPRRDERPRQEGRQQEGRQQDDRPRQDARQDERPRRDDRPRRDGAPDQRPRDDRYTRPDRTAVEVVEGPAPVPALADEQLTTPSPATQEASTVRAADMDAPLPRRRGRPPKVRPEAVAEAAAMPDADPAPLGFDADRLPPSLSVSTSAEPDAGEPAEKPRRRRRIATEPAEAGPAS